MALVVKIAAFSSVLLLVNVVSAGKIQNYIKTVCSTKDPNLNECILKQAKIAYPKILKGDPDLKIPNLMPLELDEIKIGHGPQSGIGLQLTCTKCKFYGFDKISIDDIKTDVKNSAATIKLSFPEMNIKGKYKASGKVLVLPITGDGDADILVQNGKLVYSATLTQLKKNGKSHFQLENPKVDLQTSGLKFKFTNLFNGDKNLGDNMNTFLNENWEELLKEFGPAIKETLSIILTRIVNNVAEFLPSDELIKT